MEEEKMVKKENEVTNMNDAKNKNGIIAVLIVIIIALIGAVVYFAFIKKDDKPVDNNGGNNQANNGQTNNNEKKYNNTFVYDENGSYGIAYAKGYAEVKREYYCETVSVAECNESNAEEINDVVYFHVTSTESEDLKKEINEWYGEQERDSQTFTIGCIKDNAISFGALADDFYEKVNDNINSTENYFKNIKLSVGDTNKIISSDENNPITLKFEKLKYTHGSLDFVTCMGRMTSVEIVE